jgi:hypothetical protein
VEVEVKVKVKAEVKVKVKVKVKVEVKVKERIGDFVRQIANPRQNLYLPNKFSFVRQICLGSRFC